MSLRPRGERGAARRRVAVPPFRRTTTQRKHARRAERGVGTLELVLAITIGSIAIAGIASAWGSIGLWLNRLQSQAELVREARLAREYLQRDLLTGIVVPPTDPTVLELGTAAGTVRYDLQQTELWRLTPTGQGVLVATNLDSVEFVADVEGGRLTAALAFAAGDTLLDLAMEVRELEPEALFGEGS